MDLRLFAAAVRLWTFAVLARTAASIRDEGPIIFRADVFMLKPSVAHGWFGKDHVSCLSITNAHTSFRPWNSGICAILLLLRRRKVSLAPRRNFTSRNPRSVVRFAILRMNSDSFCSSGQRNRSALPNPDGCFLKKRAKFYNASRKQSKKRERLPPLLR